MLRQSFLPSMLALLVAHALISSVTGMSAVAFAAAGFTSDASNDTLLPWPSFLPGWGTLTVSRNLLTEEYDMGLLNHPGTWDSLPRIYTIRRLGDGTCDNPYDFPRTRAVHGTLYLPEGEKYESMVKEITGPVLAELEAEKGHCGCRCKCQLGCLATLILWPICGTLNPSVQTTSGIPDLVANSILSAAGCVACHD